MSTDYLMSKLPIRQHWKNIIKILKYVYELDKGYFPVMGISLMLRASVSYMELLLSAFILDGISAHRKLHEMLTVITISVIAIMLVQFIAGAIYNNAGDGFLKNRQPGSQGIERPYQKGQ